MHFDTIADAKHHQTASLSRDGTLPDRQQPRQEQRPDGRPRFAMELIAASAVTLVILFAINFLGNGTHLFPSPLRPPMSDRAWKARRLQEIVKTEAPPRVLIFGSSRAMQIYPGHVEAITGKKTFNCCVTMGGILDCLTLLRYALHIGVKPDLALLNLDEFMLVGPPIHVARLRLSGNLGLFNQIPLHEKVEITRRVFTGINIQTTWRSIQRLAAKEPPADMSFMQQNNFLFLKDGYRVSSSRALNKVRGRLTPQSFAPATWNGERRPFNDRKLRQLREFLALAKAEGIEVYVFMTPEHPIARAGRFRGPTYENLQKLLRDECSKFGFVFRDFSELASFQGDPDEFYDEVHQTPVNMQRMTNALFGLPPLESVTRVPPDLEILQKHGMLPASAPIGKPPANSPNPPSVITAESQTRTAR